MDWGSAFAMEPWLKEPIIRRSLVAFICRADQTLHMPVSAVKIASGAAISLSVAATGSGCMGVRFPTYSTYTFIFRGFSLCLRTLVSRDSRSDFALNIG